MALTCGCAASHSAPKKPDRSVRFYPGFDAYHRTVTTDSPEAQQWFDQGIQLLYAYNHDEAIRSFEQAAAYDPDCAMAWWGVAYASGLHINNPQMSEAQSRQAWEASRKAVERIDNASPQEQALILAVSRRYASPAPEDRTELDQAYADAMQEAWYEFPDDPDICALYAESLMDLQPWDLWTPDGEPKGNAEEIVEILEEVLEIAPDHPGANHFYIHTVEASADPDRALPSADRLVDMVPGAGHLVHMPAHIYTRVGRYGDAVDCNQRAVAADRAYFELAPAPDFYNLYFVHNLHFLAYAAMMEGRYATAIQAARELERDIPESFLREWPQYADGFMPVIYHVMIRFGKWDEILLEPEAPDFRHISRAMRAYARGVAYSARGKTAEARRELAAFDKEVAMIPDDWKVGNNDAADTMAVARSMLMGELAYREGHYDQAFAWLRQGVKLEEALIYDEPPAWMQPVRHALGALLMGAGRPAEAEVVYMEDLEANHANGWALVGLEQSLRAQGKTDEADGLKEELTLLWARADVNPTSSCYCEPGR